VWQGVTGNCFSRGIPSQQRLDPDFGRLRPSRGF
jgi:hypothetical protein